MKNLKLLFGLLLLVILIISSFGCSSKPKEPQANTRKLAERVFSPSYPNRTKYSLIKNFGVYLCCDESLIEISILSSSDYAGSFVGVPTKVKKPDEIIVYYDKISPASLDIKELDVGDKPGEFWYRHYIWALGSEYYTDSIPFSIEPIKDSMYLLKTKSELKPGFYCILGIINELSGGGLYTKAHCFEIVK